MGTAVQYGDRVPEPLIRTRVVDATLVVELDREDKRNALSDALISELERTFATLPDGVRVAVITGRGAHFSAGLDLAELTERDAYGGVQHSRTWHRVLDAISYGPVPVIAALHGAVVGGGLELASAAHIRVADRTTFYALPEGRRGIFVGGSGAVRIPRLIGVALMSDMMLTGRVLDAEEGRHAGLSQYLVDEGQDLAEAMRLAAIVADNAPMTNLAVTQVLPRIANSGHDEGLMMEALMAAMAQNAPIAKERLRDFLAGRAKKVGEE